MQIDVSVMQTIILSIEVSVRQIDLHELSLDSLILLLAKVSQAVLSLVEESSR